MKSFSYLNESILNFKPFIAQVWIVNEIIVKYVIGQILKFKHTITGSLVDS